MIIKKFKFDDVRNSNKIYLIYDLNNYNFFVKLFQTKLNLPMYLSNNIKNIINKQCENYNAIEEIYLKFKYAKWYEIKTKLQKLYKIIVFTKNLINSNNELNYLYNSRVYNCNTVLYYNNYVLIPPCLFCNIDYIFITDEKFFIKILIKLKYYFENNNAINKFKLFELCGKKILFEKYVIVINLYEMEVKKNFTVSDIIYYYKLL